MSNKQVAEKPRHQRKKQFRYIAARPIASSICTTPPKSHACCFVRAIRSDQDLVRIRKTSGSVSVRRFCFVVGLFRRSTDRATARTTDAEAGEPHPKAIFRASFLLFPWIFSSHGFDKLFLHVRRDGTIQKILHRVKLFVSQGNTLPIKTLIKSASSPITISSDLER